MWRAVCGVNGSDGVCGINSDKVVRVRVLMKRRTHKVQAVMEMEMEIEMGFFKKKMHIMPEI